METSSPARYRNHQVKNQTEILELKDTINEIENFKRRLNQAEERICEQKERSLEIIQSEEKNERIKKSKENL